MTLWYLVFVSTLVNLYKDAAGTVCSDAVTDGTIVLNMCEDGNVVDEHVVIDTYVSSVYRKDGERFNCSCTATLTGLPDGTRTTVRYGPVQSLYPTPGCGSSVIISKRDFRPNTYLCTVSSNTYHSVQTNDTFIVVWQSGASGSTSGYCLSLTAVSAVPASQPSIYFCTVLNNTINRVQTNDTVTVEWQSRFTGSTTGYCLLFRAGPGSSLSTNCLTISSQRETTTASQSRTTTTQSGETNTQSRETTTQSGETTTPSRETTTQSRETTTHSRMTTTQLRETTTYNSTNSGSTTLGQKCVQQNDFQQCYPLSALVVPLVVTSLLITVTVVVHFILYRKRLALVKQPEYTRAVMTSPNPVHYDSLDLSRVEPPNLYADISTGQMYVNTAMES